MNANGIRRLAAAAAAAGLVLALTGCRSSSSSSSGSSAGTASSAAPGSSVQAAGCRTGFGVNAALTEDDLSGKATLTAAGVLLDQDGKILRCVIDVAENDFGANADGTLAMPGAYSTKWEMGDSYGLKAASGIGKEWYEQSQAFCDYVQGMTAEQVAGIETDDGRASDPDLLAGCTIRVAPFVAALTKACDNAKALGAADTDTLSLGTVSTPSGTDAMDDADGKAEVATTFVALTKDGDGRVTSAVMDQIIPYFTVDTTGALTAPVTATASKLEMGDDYGLKNASGIGKEWYQQSEGFCAFLKGKTAGDIRGIPANGTDADLAAVCTIDWNDMLQAAIKAAEAV